MTLDEFINETKQDIIKFEKWWREQHKKQPEYFPMESEEDDVGMWFESFISFSEMDMEDSDA